MAVDDSFDDNPPSGVPETVILNLRVEHWANVYARKRADAKQFLDDYIREHNRNAWWCKSHSGALVPNEILLVLPPLAVLSTGAWRTYNTSPLSMPEMKFLAEDMSLEDKRQALALITKAEKVGRKAYNLRRQMSDILDDHHQYESTEMKLTLLAPLLEVEDNYDPWNDANDTAYPKYKALSQTATAVKHRLDHNNAELSELLSTAMKTGKSVSRQRPVGITQADTYESVWFDNLMYYVSTDPTDKLAQKISKLFKRIQKDQDYLRDAPAHRNQQAKGAAIDYLQQRKLTPGSVVDQNEIYENIRVYHKEEEKFKWLHNPVKFGEDPKYAGSPDHYDWKGVFATVYFLLADWLEENGTPFQKVFAAMDEGKPWIVAVAANHAFVLHIHETTGIVYVRGQEPLPAKKFLEQAHGVLSAIKNTLQVSVQDLDKHGAVAQTDTD